MRTDRLPRRLADLVRALPEDPVVTEFERRSQDGGAPGHGALRGMLRGVLRHVVSDFDADGLLGTHPMALFGPTAWSDLLGARRRLLDIGAGSGDVTIHAREVVREVVTTEISAPMARRLRARGLVCHRADLSRGLPPDLGEFDAVSLCNVLDRCARPRTLLQTALGLVEPGGVLLLTVPLPARPHVDMGRATVDPDEPFAGDGDSFESALVDLVERFLEPCGMVIARLARAPYLSRGRADTLHRLDAAVIVGS